jgi:hypothetical protein
MTWERDRHCPNLDMLERYVRGEAPSERVAAHLGACEACWDELEALRDRLVEQEARPESAAAEPAAPVPTPPLPEFLKDLAAEGWRRLRPLAAGKARPAITAFGQVWSTRAAAVGATSPELMDIPRIVVVLADENLSYDARHPDVVVAPICEAGAIDVPGNVLVHAAEGPLGYDFLVEAWNRQATLAACLDRYLGELSPEARARLQKRLQSEADAEAPAANAQAFMAAEIEDTAYLRRPIGELLDLWEREAEPARVSELLRQIVPVAHAADWLVGVFERTTLVGQEWQQLRERAQAAMSYFRELVGPRPALVPEGVRVEFALLLTAAPVPTSIEVRLVDAVGQEIGRRPATTFGPRILRGRFSMVVELDKPDLAGREALLVLDLGGDARCVIKERVRGTQISALSDRVFPEGISQELPLAVVNVAVIAG